MKTDSVVEEEWTWTPMLYAGSAAYYASGRVPYPKELADRLAAELGLAGVGRLLDVGCGPGSLTLLLAGLFEHAVGIDADADMLAEAARQGSAAGITGVDWICMRAEDLPAGLGRFTVVTLAQSFHWLDRESVAATLRGMLDDDGVLVHVGATTHQGIASTQPMPYPSPPREQIERLVGEYLHDEWEAGRGAPRRRTGGDEDAVFRGAGFRGPTVVTVPGRTVVRSADEIVAGVFSLSSSTPALFGSRRSRFESDLRLLLRTASRSGQFCEQMREIDLSIWRP